jgi:transketolase N-terminal domain/subunit
MKKEILEFSYKHQLGHIASALSMSAYLNSVFKYVKKDDKIVLGKPFAAQAYYVLWKKLGWIDDIDSLSVGVKHDEIDFVDYSEETMGNALGVASGIAMTTNKKVYVNLSDAALQMGNTLEAIQFIGQHQQNILVTVDMNNAQVTGSCSDIINVYPVVNFFKQYNWNVYELQEDADIYDCYHNTKPTVIIFNTKKGSGILEIERNIKKWHYKKIETSSELQSLVEELQDI